MIILNLWVINRPPRGYKNFGHIPMDWALFKHLCRINHVEPDFPMEKRISEPARRVDLWADGFWRHDVPLVRGN